MKGFTDIVRKIETFLKSKAVVTNRENLIKGHFEGYDLIISVGGDGTFLRTCQHITNDIPIIGINPDPTKKEGFFTSANLNNFQSKLSDILMRNYKTQKLLRLYAKINGKVIEPLCLNEFFIGNIKPQHMSYYELTYNKQVELQKSSGIIIGTPQGSYSWINSAGGSRMDLKKSMYQFIVREPYNGKLTITKLHNKILKFSKKIKIKTKFKKLMPV